MVEDGQVTVLMALVWSTSALLQAGLAWPATSLASTSPDWFTTTQRPALQLEAVA